MRLAIACHDVRCKYRKLQLHLLIFFLQQLSPQRCFLFFGFSHISGSSCSLIVFLSFLPITFIFRGINQFFGWRAIKLSLRGAFKRRWRSLVWRRWRGSWTSSTIPVYPHSIFSSEVGYNIFIRSANLTFLSERIVDIILSTKRVGQSCSWSL